MISSLVLVICLLSMVNNSFQSGCEDCQCQRIVTLCCDDVCNTEVTQYACPTSPPTSSPSCLQDFITNFPTGYGDLIVNSPVQANSYVYGTLVLNGVTYNDVELYCVDYEHILFSYSPYNETLVYPFNEVIANPSLAANIEEPNRLNQVAWILENVHVGDEATGPQIWSGNLYSGCSTITASDIQIAIWALVSSACDGSGLCLDSIESSTDCNAAYIKNAALAAVPDGTTYTISGSNYPVILVPSNDQVLITNWNTQCYGPSSAPTTAPTVEPTIAPTIAPTVAPTSCECAYNFIESFPTSIVDFVVNQPVQTNAYVYGSLLTSTGLTYEGVNLYCIDYFNMLISDTNYNETLAYPYTEVIANSALASHIQQPNRLNQVAWILNNIVLGSVAPSPQTWHSVIYSDCGAITSSDIQSAIWALTSSPGLCDSADLPCNDGLGPVNTCNVAYIYNTALTTVPDGTDYLVTGDASYVPVVFVPSETSQVLITNFPTECTC
jgi:hypothetical protein